MSADPADRSGRSNPGLEVHVVTDPTMPGRGLVTRRAVGDVVRRAALGSYGVVGVSGPRPWDTWLAWLGRATPGVRVRVGPPLTVDLYLSVARHVPVAEVARNVDSAVRYAVRRALDRDVDELAVHVDRIRSPRGRYADAADPSVADPAPERSATGDTPAGENDRPAGDASVGPETA